MRKAVYFLILLLAVIVGVAGGRVWLQSSVQPQTAHVVQPTSPELLPNPTVIVGDPKTLAIPKINLADVPIEFVGKDSLGRMDIPKNVMDTAWYKLGFKPGEKGSAVIDGHLDTVTGAPAVFYNLNQLQKGDEISVTDNNGKKYKFAVEKIATYDFDKLPLQEIFASQDKSRLNLITCNGSWDNASRNYSKRMVVYAVAQ